MSDASQQPAPPSRPRISPWELAPAWIGALAALIVALSGAGFFAGRASVGTAPAGGVAAVPTTPAAATVSTPGASPTVLGGDAKLPAGTQLSTYSFMVVRGYSVPLGDSAPTQSQFVVGRTAGDIYFDPNFSTLVPVDGSAKMIALGNVPPTYQGCTTSTVFAGSVTASQVGSSFCLLKQGRVIGGTVTATRQAVDDPIRLAITVWAGPAT